MIRISLASSQATLRVCVQMCLSALLSMLRLAEAMCLPVLVTFERLSILLTIGGCFESYYMMVLSLLLDCWRTGIVIKSHVSGGKIVCLGVFDLAMTLGSVEFCHPICSQGTLGNCYVSWLKPMLVAILVLSLIHI